MKLLKATFLVMAITMLAFVLVGCGADAPEATPTPTPEVVETPEPTPTPTPEPTPEPEEVADDTYVFQFRNLLVTIDETHEIVEHDASISILTYDDTVLAIFAYDISDAESEEMANALTLTHHTGTIGSFSNRTDEESGTDTIAGYDAYFDTFVGESHGRVLLGTVVSFHDGEYSYVLMFAVPVASDNAIESTDIMIAVLDRLEPA